MTEANKDRLAQVSGVISQVLLEKKLPDLNEGLCRLQTTLKELEILDERGKLEDDVLSLTLSEIDDVTRQMLRLARHNNQVAEEEKRKWRFR